MPTDPITVEVVCDACDATGQASDRHDCWACGGEGTRLMVASPTSLAAAEIALARAVDRCHRECDGDVWVVWEALRSALVDLRAHPEYKGAM